MKQFLSFIIALFPFTAFAQTPIAFSYDAAGNRVSSQIYIQRGDSLSQDADTQRVTDWQVTVYPNPTHGHLVVKILNWTEDVPCTISLYTLTGGEVMKTKVVSESTDVDMTYYADGIYILQVRIGDESKSWKIIKES